MLTSPGADETYYIAKSDYILKNATLPKVEESKLAVLHRTPGYPLILAAFGVNKENFVDRKIRVSVLQFSLVTINLTLMFWLAVKLLGNRKLLVPVSVFLILQPWCYETTRSYLSDSLALSFYTLGILFLLPAFYIENRRLRMFSLLSSSFILGLSTFLRTEMLLFASLSLFAGAIMASNTPFPPRRMWIGILVFSFFVMIHVGYRFWSGSALIPKFQQPYPGLHRWTSTWIASEKTKYGLYWGFLSRKISFEDIPSTAFANDWEREKIRTALILVEKRKSYDKEIDSIFENVAKYRIKNNRLKAVILPRLFNAANLWVNPYSNDYVGIFLKHVKTSIRYGILIIFLVTKGILFAGAILSVVPFIKFQRWKKIQWFDLLWVITFTNFISRTVVIGIIMNIGEHRHVLTAWTSLFWCNIYLLYWAFRRPWIPEGLRIDSSSASPKVL